MQNVTKTEIAAALQILLAACQQDQVQVDCFNIRDAQAAYDKLKELEANNSSKRIEQTMADLGLNNDQVIEWLVDYNSIREIVKATN